MRRSGTRHGRIDRSLRVLCCQAIEPTRCWQMETLEHIHQRSERRSAPDGGRKGNGSAHGHGHLRPTLLQRFAQHRLRIAVAVLLASAGTGALRLSLPETYSSTAVLLVDAPRERQLLGVQLPDVSPGFIQVYYAATSTEILDQLIDSFALRAHYGIAADDPMGHARVTERLLRAIQPHYLDAPCMSISVYDHDRQMALAIATALQQRLIQQARRNTELALERSVAVNARVLERAKDRARERTAHLAHLVAKELARVPVGKNDEYADARLQRAIDMLTASEVSIAEIQRSLDFATELLAEPDLPNVLLIRAASLDTTPSLLPKAIWMALVTIPFALILIATGIAVWHFHGHELLVWINSPSPR